LGRRSPSDLGTDPTALTRALERHLKPHQADWPAIDVGAALRVARTQPTGL